LDHSQRTVYAAKPQIGGLAMQIESKAACESDLAPLVICEG